MSVPGSLSSDPNKISRNSFLWRNKNDSGELDVFEAARYFSGANENPGHYNGFDRPATAARMSLDMPMMMIRNNHPINPVDQKELKETKKYKQPSSPGGRLASFLNSLFSQTASRKKKKKKSKSDKDHMINVNPDQEDQSPGGRRKRRSSISSIISAADDKTSNTSGFRTPPPCANTPTKSYKEFRRFFEHVSEKNGNVFKNNGFSDRINNICSDRTANWADEEREFRKFSDVDDGGDTDSSSDLFDLPNHELDFYSSGLPVYGTTSMDRIRIGAAV